MPSDTAPHGRFNQREWTDAVASRLPKHPAAKLVAFYLAMRADFDTGTVPPWVTREAIAAGCNLHERTVGDAVTILVGIGCMTALDGRHGTGRRLVPIAHADQRHTTVGETVPTALDRSGIGPQGPTALDRRAPRHWTVPSPQDPPVSPAETPRTPAPAHTHEDRPTNGTDHNPPHTDPVPGGTADPWRTVATAVVDAYVSALEERAGVLPRQPPPKDGRAVVDLVRAELAAADRDDPAKVTAAAVRVTRFFATGFPSDRNMPPLWRLANFETFRRQWDMAQDAAAALPPPPRRQTADEMLDAALRNPSLREFVTVTPEERAAVNAERDAARAERRAERMVEVVTGLMHKRMAQGYIAAVQP